MKINSIYLNTCFNGRPAHKITKKVDSKSSNNITNTLYADISKYQNGIYDKQKYFSQLAKILKRLDNFDSLSEAECKYFSELLMAIDEAGNIDNLPDNHLNKIMDELLNN